MRLDEETYREANHKLLNWGRHVNDGWLRNNLLFTPPPTSEGYVAPFYDPAERSPYPIDELDAELSERVVIRIGTTPGQFDFYRALVYWYPHLMLLRFEGTELTHDQSLKRLSRYLRCSFDGARRILDDAVHAYWFTRLTLAAEKL